MVRLDCKISQEFSICDVSTMKTVSTFNGKPKVPYETLEIALLLSRGLV